MRSSSRRWVTAACLASGVAGVVYVVNKDDGTPGANPTAPTGGTGQPAPAGGSAKYDAWEQVVGMGRKEAMESYIALIDAQKG